ncbi:MAG: hypothetical protein FP831_10250 [Anaerolineae bacterium]|nr:hypothetical protein [Anaerolineae bacterium]
MLAAQRYGVSVGMFEHVGRHHLPEYFSQTYLLLKLGVCFSITDSTDKERPPQMD